MPAARSPSWTAPLRAIALAHPGTTEGVACEGTVIEKRTLEIGGRAFLFLGPADAMLKLASSIPDARAAEAAAPGNCRVGAGGWIKLAIDRPPRPRGTPGGDRAGTAPLPTKQLTAWIAESYHLAAAKPSKRPSASNAPSKKPSPTRTAPTASKAAAPRTAATKAAAPRTAATKAAAPRLAPPHERPRLAVHPRGDPPPPQLRRRSCARPSGRVRILASPV